MAGAAEAGCGTQTFWEMHEMLFRPQQALEDDDLDANAEELALAQPGSRRTATAPMQSDESP